MTRRIALAILMIVWLMLLTAGISTYFITRTLLLADLDETILGRVASLPEIERPASLPRAIPFDRFVIQNPLGRNFTSPTTASGDVPPPKVIAASFGNSLPDGPPLRTLTVQAYERRENPGDPLVPVTVVYSASMDHVNLLLKNLLVSLTGFGLVAAGATGMVASSVAKVALRPMRDVATVIGEIDEKTLDRRIAVEKLPAELIPVGRKLNDMLGRLETAFAQRKQFLADASHELRTPVAAIVTTLEVALRRGRDVEGYVNVLHTCLSDARLLHQIVVALLDQVRSERFANEIELTPVPVSDVLRQSSDMARTLGSTKNISVDRDYPDYLVLLTDEVKLRSMITNLISNAVEYTQSGGHISVTATFRPLEPNQRLPEAFTTAIPDGVATAAGVFVIQVIDNGPGITPAHLPHLFEPFYRADSARVNAEHHLGLGLSLVRSHAQALGGECRVVSPYSTEHSGCQFTVELPTVQVSLLPPSMMPRRAPLMPHAVKEAV